MIISSVLASLSGTGESALLRALWPALVALLLTLVTHQAIVGLLFGALTGVLFLTGGNVFRAVTTLTEEHFFPAFSGSWHVGAILFTLILGAFAMVIERSGGFETLANRLLSRKKGDAQRGLEATTAGLGLLCFFDGLANSLLLGRITKPLADKLRVPRARLAYIVDSTSSSVACIAFISTWIATQLSLIEQSIRPYTQVEDSAYQLFFRSIPNNFYCLFTLIFLAFVIVRKWDIGPMKRAKAEEVNELEAGSEDKVMTPVRVVLIPIFILSVAILTLFYTWDTATLFPITTEKLSAAFSGSAGPYALTVGALIGLFAACVFFPKGKRGELSETVTSGVATMLQPVLLLVLAWTFGSVISELGTGKWVAAALGTHFPVNYLPAAIFVTGAVMALVTGSSWGTMALLMPIAIPAYLDLAMEAGGDVSLLPAAIAAVFSGAVFGDHCSPFSDTTIVSAFACGVSPQEHVMTQLPYALIAAGTALLLGFVVIANGVSAVVAIVLGTVFLGGLSFWATRHLSSAR
ncbi:MAG: Na+/H+ antiporter NhaC family protein [Akkermansiaceae bacterium]